MPLFSPRSTHGLPGLVTAPVARRGVLGWMAMGAAGAALAGCHRAGETLRVGSQKGGTKALVEASDALAGAGYRVEWAEFPAAQNLLEAIASDAVDVGMVGDGPFAFAYQSGQPIVAVAARRVENRPAGALAVVVRAASPAHGMADIAGQKLATTRGSIGHYLALRALAGAGMAPDAVHFVFLSPSDAAAALRSGAVAAWATWAPYTMLAQAEGAQGRPVSGQRFLTALAVGGDVACRMGLALRRPMEAGGWYPPPILAGMGAAAGAASLLGLPAAQVRDALSLMLCQNVMPGEIKHSPGTVIRAVREGFPAQAAVLSALLAREGVAGFEQPIEGRSGFYALYAGGQYDADALAGDLGRTYWIEQLTFKRWPSCRGTHPFIEMALELTRGIDPARIAAIEVGIDDVQRMLTEPAGRKAAPQTAIDAKFSIPFTTALACARGRVGLEDFDAPSLADPVVLALAAKVHAVPEDGQGWQRGSGGRMAITLSDGQVLRAQQADALGCPARPLGEAALVAKFVDCAGRAAVPAGDPVALARAILNIAQRDDVAQLFS